MLCHALVKWLFGLSDVEVWAFLTALYSIHHVVKSVFWSFVFRVNQFVSECVAGSEVHWDVVLGENSPEFL